MNDFQRHCQPFLQQLNDDQPTLPPVTVQQPDPIPQPDPTPQPDPQPPTTFQLIQGRRPTDKQLLHQGFRYVGNGGHREKKYWRCYYHKKDAHSHNPLPCKSILHTTGDIISRNPSPQACMLAFVPPEDVVDSWEQISAEYPEELDDFITYFERTWVGRRGRRRPLYDIHRWNQRERVLQGLMTTNNNVEGFHYGFVSLVGYLNPTIWDWLNAVRAKQTLSANDMARQQEDRPAPKSYPQILARRRELLTRVRSYADRDLFEFLEVCNISM